MSAEKARGGTAPCGLLRALGEVAAPRAALRAPPAPFRVAGPLLGGLACGMRWRPAFFRCAPLPDSAFC